MNHMSRFPPSTGLNLLIVCLLSLVGTALSPTAFSHPTGDSIPIPDLSQGTVISRIEPGEYSLSEEHGHHSIQMQGFGCLGEPGAPDLPGRIFAVAIPPGTEPTGVSVEAGEVIEVPGLFSIAPLPLPHPLGNEDPVVTEEARKSWRKTRDRVYGSDAAYPADPGCYVRWAGFRQYTLVDVRISPFRYHPKSGRLFVHRSLSIRVDFARVVDGAEGFSSPAGHLGTAELAMVNQDGEGGGRQRPVTTPMIGFQPSTEQTAREIILNYDDARAWYGEPAEPAADRFDFVIITRQNLESALDPLVQHETAKGRNVRVVTVEWITDTYSGRDTAEAIRNFLRDTYPSSSWGIRDVLLAGHRNQVPVRHTAADTGYGSPHTDFYYAELSRRDEESWDKDGDGQYGEPDDDDVDFYAEVNVGRIPWSDADILRAICEKTVAFEQNADPSFKKSILVLGAFWYSDYDAADTMEYLLAMPSLSDWTATRLYEQNTDYWSAHDCDLPLNNTNVVNTWSSGRYSYVDWGGHGSATSCHILGLGAPAFIRTGDCSSLNDEAPGVVYTIACNQTHNGTYTNIGREMLRQGAVGFVGCCNVAYGGGADWDPYSPGSMQSADYWFTSKVTSGEMTLGEAHQWSLRNNYINGWWYYNHYEMFNPALYGSPGLRLAPRPPGDSLLAVAPGPARGNPSTVCLYDAGGPLLPISEFSAYGVDRYGANVAMGDVDGDGELEIVTGPGPGAVFGPHVRVFEQDGTPVAGAGFLAYGTNKYGVKVSCGDLDGDGRDEIITGAGPGAVFGPHVRAFSFSGATVTPLPGVSFFAYGTQKYGVNVACGDLDGDGRSEIITGAGPGPVFGAHVRAFSLDAGEASPIPEVSFLAYGNRRWGVNVACGDILGNGISEIVTGAGPGAALGSHVRAFRFTGSGVETIPEVNLFAYPGAGCGVTVSCGDVDGDGVSEIITGPGPDQEMGALVRGWNCDGDTLTAIEGFEFTAFSSDVTHGANTSMAVR